MTDTAAHPPDPGPDGPAGDWRVTAWNVNSIRARTARVQAWLAQARPDVVVLGETRSGNPADTTGALEPLGYTSTVACGTGADRGRAGVAVATRHAIVDARCGLPDAALELLGERAETEGWAAQLPRWAADARWVDATITTDHDDSDVSIWRVLGLYVPNGRELDDPHLAYKLAFLDAVAVHAAELAASDTPAVICGDINVAPGDLDVWNPRAWQGRTHVSPAERARIAALEAAGWTDTWRQAHPEAAHPNVHGADTDGFTWWNYRSGGYQKDHGLRIDLILTNPAATARLTDVTVDRDERDPALGQGAPSDHAPVTARFHPDA